MEKLIFRPPDPDAPGYLRRAKKSLEFRQKIVNNDTSPETIDTLVDFLLQYIEEPKDREKARELLFDASEKQFLELLDVVSGSDGANPTPAQQKKEQ